jgi:small subunit ribosomal protein S5
MEDKKIDNKNKQAGQTKAVLPVASEAAPFDSHKAGGKRFGGRRPGGSKPNRKRSDRPAEEFEQKIVDLARVTRVMAGGKRMKFRACMIIGDKKGRVGIGIAKGVDVSQAISKAVVKAKKNTVHVPVVEGTVPHQISVKFKSAKVMIRPAKQGSGIKAGGVLRIILELAGVKDVVAKILGSNNKINNAKAAVEALSSFIPRAASYSHKPQAVKSAVVSQPVNNRAREKTLKENKK